MSPSDTTPTSAPRAPSAARVKERASELGFALAGVARVHGSAHADFYRAWLGRGMHGSMGYLAREDAVARRIRPDEAWPALKSAIVLALPYEATGATDCVCDCDGVCVCTAPAAGVVARYARGRDYHRVVKSKLMELLRWLELETGQRLPAARAYVDTGPVLERELAQRAGLGWFGRNTMLINPGIGSYFFLGALLVEIELEADDPFIADRCGTCTRCVSACPTGALLGRDESGAPVMDATRCISYLTIENRGPIPAELRPLIGNRIFGCDICQEVCPWNGRGRVRVAAGETAARGHGHGHAHGVPPAGARTPGEPVSRELADAQPPVELRPRMHGAALVDLLRLRPEEWDAMTRGSALRRPGYGGFRRNVAVAIGNAGRVEDVGALAEALDDADALVRGHAAWALGRIGGMEARRALRARLAAEPDPDVRQELEAALAAAASPDASSSRSAGSDRSITP